MRTGTTSHVNLTLNVTFVCGRRRTEFCSCNYYSGIPHHDRPGSACGVTPWNKVFPEKRIVIQPITPPPHVKTEDTLVCLHEAATVSFLN
jgi:hypothetical protein